MSPTTDPILLVVRYLTEPESLTAVERDLLVHYLYMESYFCGGMAAQASRITSAKPQPPALAGAVPGQATTRGTDAHEKQLSD